MKYEEKLSVLQDNLSLLESRRSISDEQHSLMLRSIADSICSNFENESINELCDAYRTAVNLQTTNSEKILYDSILRSPKLFLDAKALISIGSDEKIADEACGKISFVKNKFNDMAYSMLSREVASPSQTIVASPQEACELVANGAAEFCILPIENSRDGKLFGFYGILNRFELKICLVCNIETDDEFGNIKYALISRSCREPWEYDISKDEFVFEFSVLSENANFLCELLEFAKLCGATPLTVDSKPIQYDSQLRRYIFSFLIKNELTFLMYPPLMLTGYSPIGFYPKF